MGRKVKEGYLKRQCIGCRSRGERKVVLTIPRWNRWWCSDECMEAHWIAAKNVQLSLFGGIDPAWINRSIARHKSGHPRIKRDASNSPEGRAVSS